MVKKERGCGNRRRVNERKERPTILIGLEGKGESEKKYFQALNQKYRNHYNIRFATGNETDPIGIVKNVEDSIRNMGLDTKNGDLFFCVIDADYDSSKESVINKAKHRAKDKGIKVIISNPCFELWLLLHFTKTTKLMNSIEVERELKTYLSRYKKGQLDFSKFESKIDEAVKRAKEIKEYCEQYRDGDGITGLAPITFIYEIVELLCGNKGDG